MANHSSANKAIRHSAKRTLINKNNKSRIKTFLKKADASINGDDKIIATEAFIKAQSVISKGIKKGIVSKNAAARTISKLAARLKSMNSRITSVQ